MSLLALSTFWLQPTLIFKAQAFVPSPSTVLELFSNFDMEKMMAVESLFLRANPTLQSDNKLPLRPGTVALDSEVTHSAQDWSVSVLW